MSGADWADYRQAAADDAHIQDEVADRENQVENGLIGSYDEYPFSWGEVDDHTLATELSALAAEFERTLESLTLLDSVGSVPSGPLAPLLHQQVRQTQALARAAGRVLDTATRPDQCPDAQGAAALAQLASAAAMSATAVGRLAEALRIESAPPRIARHHVEWRLVFTHAESRRDLRKAGEALRAAEALYASPSPAVGISRSAVPTRPPTPGSTRHVHR
ncbi:hypothetical protein [Streptomyces sp. NPDC058622]|uniref:hypothetical protein n=1 Tax=Streptomyces sp. NPDC058622 TaxID=3346562 RepID=UPI00364E6F26